MRRLIAFLAFAACGWFTYKTTVKIDLAAWRTILEYERERDALAAATELTGEAGTGETVALLKKTIHQSNQRGNVARQEREALREQTLVLVALGIIAFIVWVWPKSAARVATGTTQRARDRAATRTTRRARGTVTDDAPATHRTPGGETIAGLVELEPGERLEFLANTTAESANRAMTACQVCGEALESDVVTCRVCRTPHHEECWEWNNGCTTFGCGERAFQRSNI